MSGTPSVEARISTGCEAALRRRRATTSAAVETSSATTATAMGPAREGTACTCRRRVSRGAAARHGALTGARRSRWSGGTSRTARARHARSSLLTLETRHTGGTLVALGSACLHAPGHVRRQFTCGAALLEHRCRTPSARKALEALKPFTSTAAMSWKSTEPRPETGSQLRGARVPGVL
jgi:hypothetical protein